MKYRVQEHEEKKKEFIVYMMATNGEIFREVCRCRDKKDADYISAFLNENCY